MTEYTAEFAGNSRVASCPGIWQAACDGDVADWQTTNKFWIALLAQCAAHSCASVAMKLQWQKDGGAWNNLGVTGEIKQTTGCTDPGASDCKTVVERIVLQGDDSAAFVAHSKDEYIELVVACDPSDAIPGSKYTFRLYDMGNITGLFPGYAEITIATAVPEVRQKGGRIGVDDCDHTGIDQHTWADTCGTQADVAQGTNFRVAITVENTEGSPKSINPQLECSLTSGGIYSIVPIGSYQHGVKVETSICIVDDQETIGDTPSGHFCSNTESADKITTHDSTNPALTPRLMANTARVFEFNCKVDPSATLQAVYFRITDSGTGLDFYDGYISINITAAGVSKDVSDSGSGSDSVDIEAQIPVSDSGGGVDDVGLEIQVPVSDLGSGADAILVEQLREVSDSGSGADDVAVEQSKDVSDSGSGSDDVDIEAQVPISDTGGGVDDISVEAQVPVSDSGSGVDDVSIEAQVPVSDSGGGVDDVSIEAQVPLSDSGLGADDVDIEAQVPVSDGGSGVDDVTVDKGEDYKDVSDIGSGVDDVGVEAQVPVSDGGSGADDVDIEAQVPVSDGGSGVDDVGVEVQVPVSDSGLGSENVSIEAQVPVSDTGGGSDGVTVDKGGPGGADRRGTGKSIYKKG